MKADSSGNSHQAPAEGVITDRVDHLGAQVSLANYAHKAIRKHFKKSIKYCDQVLKDTDPEPLHQMRVGMRRLRTALAVFAPAIQVPPAASHQAIGKIARKLGSVRDLDVLYIWFETYRQSAHLTPSEVEIFQTVLDKLQKQRKKHFSSMEKMLAGKSYKDFLTTLQDWIDHPVYGPLGNVPITLVLPDLLSPLISGLLLHPGWLVGTRSHTSQVHPLKRITRPVLNKHLADGGPVLHDLRKQAKRVRYQTEFFTEFYGEAYAEKTREFRSIQEILGQLQDQTILSQFLLETVGASWPSLLPSLEAYFQQERMALWKQWQPIQHSYLDLEGRDALRRTILTLRA